MPSSTVRPKGSHGFPRLGVPMSERQQLALLRKLTSNAEQGNPGTSRTRNERGETPLHLAAIRGDEVQVGQLLALGADVNATDFAGWTPLHEACNYGFYTVAQALLHAGASVNARGLDDDTPLHDAAVNGHVKLVKLLIRSGADMTLRNRRGRTPADVAAPSVRDLLHQPPVNNSEKSNSPRVTLRLHQIKARDEKRANKVAAAAADVASYDNRVQFSVSMEGKNGCEDVYEFKSSKEATPVRGNSASPDLEKKDSSSAMTETKDTHNSPVRQDSGSDQANKRTFADVSEGGEEGDEENKRKKRKDSEGSKENARNSGSVSGRFSGGRNGVGMEKCSKVANNNSKNGSGANNKNTYGSGNNGNTDRKSPNSTGATAGNSPKLSTSSAPGGNSGKALSNLPPESDSEGDETRGKSSSAGSAESGSSHTWTGGPKVPPLKIVIPQQSTSMEQEQGNRNGKNGAARHHQALPYVVASSNSNDSVTEKESSQVNAGPNSNSSTAANTTVDSGTNGVGTAKGDEKKEGISSGMSAEDQRSTHHQRVLRSSHRSGTGASSGSANTNVAPTTTTSTTPVSSSSVVSGASAASPTSTSSSTALNSITNNNGNSGSNNNSNSGPVDRSSNNSSPNQSNSQRQSPAPMEVVTTSAPSTEASTITTTTTSTKTSSPTPVPAPAPPEEKTAEAPEPPNPTPPPPAPPQPPPVELHPRKRKMKQSKENQSSTSTTTSSESTDTTNTTTEVHPHEQPITNCYQLFLNIRKQIERRRKGLFPVQPKPPQGFKDYLMNRCTYVLAGNATSRMSVPVVSPPQNLQGAMKDLFTEQEKERYRLRMQHVIEKEKLVLSVEQEILRVHGRAARALANQSLPFSVCTILKDEEVYNVITPEQEEKDRNARSRYNGRLFLSWLQDVDDKWEKIKESMLLRHHNEAESLHAVQKMDWEWKMKELGICEFKAKPVIEDVHVPMVHVSDDFDLLPA